MTKEQIMKERANGGKKRDGKKIKLHLMDPYFEEDMGKLLTYGASIYGDDNWKKVDPESYISALKRHTLEVQKGHYIDKDSGLPHVAAIAVNAMFLHYLLKQQL